MTKLDKKNNKIKQLGKKSKKNPIKNNKCKKKITTKRRMTE